MAPSVDDLDEVQTGSVWAAVTGGGFFGFHRWGKRLGVGVLVLFFSFFWLVKAVFFRKKKREGVLVLLLMVRDGFYGVFR